MAARRRRVLVDVGGSSSEARREIREVRDDLRRLGREEVEARIDVNERVVLSKIDRVQERIRRLKAQDASVDVDVKLAGAYAQLDRLNLRLDRLKTKRVNIDVDVSRGGLERTAAGLGFVERGVRGVSKGFANIFHQVPIVGGLFESVLGGAFSLATSLGSAIGGLATEGLGTLARTLGSTGALAAPIGAVVGQIASLGLALVSVGVLAGGLVIALNAVLGAIIALGSALVALVASAAAAAAGLGALAIALGAALIPVALVAFGIFQRFQAILKAHQAQQQQVAAATQDAKTAEQAHTAALEARRRAEEQLAAATVEGRKQMAQAALDERDAELGLRTAKTGVEDTKLQLALAKRDLRDFLRQAGAVGPTINQLVKRFQNVDFDPSQAGRIFGGATGGKKVDPLDLRQKIQAVRDAQDGVANATNRVTHAERDLAAARQKEADFASRGLRAYAPYRQALEAVAGANRRVARSQAQTSAAQRKYETALKGLSATEQGSLGRVNALVDGFTRLAKKLADPIFTAANAVFDQLKGHAGEFEGALGQVSDAIAEVVGAIGRFLTEPATLSAFKVLASGASDLVRQLGARAFTSFLRIMREIATTALPVVVHYAHLLADRLEGVAHNGRGIRSVVKGLVSQFETWAGLGWQLLRAVVGVFRGAAGPGKSLAGSLTTIVKKFADWANSREGQARIRAFFERMIEKAKKIVHWLIQAAVWLKDHLPGAAKTAGDAFALLFDAIKPIVTPLRTAYRVLKSIRDLVNGDLKKAFSDLKPLDILKSLNATNSPPAKIFKKFWGTVLGRAAGGPVPGSGRGDHVPALLEPGEFVLKRAVVQALSLPVVHALNGGGVPQLAPAGPSMAPVVHIHNRFSAPGGRAADERSSAAALEREFRKAMVR